MSLEYLKKAVEQNDRDTLIRYVRLHFGDGDERAGAREIDKSWIEALKLLLELPETNRELIFDLFRDESPQTLAHLFFHLHFYFAKQSGEWIHDGQL